MKRPQKLPLKEIYDLLPQEVRQNKKRISYRNNIGVIVEMGNYLFSNLFPIISPFLIEDYRMGLVMQGELHVVINLQKYVAKKGTMLLVTPGTIVEPVFASDDMLIDGVGLSAEKFHLALGNNVPEVFSEQTSNRYKVISQEEGILLDQMFRLLLSLAEREDTSERVIFNMVSTISHYFDQQFRKTSYAIAMSHSREQFNRFLRLVNLHGAREHQLSFYAGKLCITSRYLGTLVQKTSGVSAKEWISRAIISTAKVMLCHSDRQVAQISDELNFPNVSFFCKYFKRLTGLTPRQYREENAK